MDDRPVWAARVVGAPSAYLIVAAPPRPFPIEKAAAFISAWLLVLAVAAFPLARAMARPMERLTDAARKLGAGDLSVRAGLRRSDEVGELSSAFDDMAGRLEGLVRSERQLLADVSHELRTPLSRIRVALDLAAEGDVVRAQKYLEEIRLDLAELDQLLGDVLTAARLDQAGGRGEVPLRLQQVGAQEIVDRAAERFRHAHPGRELTVHLEAPLPRLVADPSMLRRVLDNLLDNAVKYSESPAPVEVVARREGSDFLVSVRDAGHRRRSRATSPASSRPSSGPIAAGRAAAAAWGWGSRSPSGSSRPTAGPSASRAIPASAPRSASRFRWRAERRPSPQLTQRAWRKRKSLPRLAATPHFGQRRPNQSIGRRTPQRDGGDAERQDEPHEHHRGDPPGQPALPEAEPQGHEHHGREEEGQVAPPEPGEPVAAARCPRGAPPITAAAKSHCAKPTLLEVESEEADARLDGGGEQERERRDVDAAGSLGRAPPVRAPLGAGSRWSSAGRGSP